MPPFHPEPIMMPEKEPGRNDPCWCRSGKKYKKCHLGRERQPRVNPHQLMKDAMAPFQRKYCSHPGASANVCSRVIRAHTITKSLGLRSIAEDSHVYSCKEGYSDLRKNKGHLVPRKVGINQASTFSGFCGKHDNATFEPIERGKIDFSNQSIFLLSYRAMVLESYLKDAQLDMFRLYKEHFDRGFDLVRQVEFQNKINEQISGAETAARVLRIFKDRYDAMLVSGDFSALKWLAIRLDTLLPIVSAGGRTPDYDFWGRPLYNLFESYDVLPLTVTNIINDQSGSIVSLAWLRDDEKSAAFADGVLQKTEELGPDFLVHFGIATYENTYYRPSWWESLTDDDQKRLIDAARSDINSTVPSWYEAIQIPMTFGLNGKVVDFQKNY